MKQEFTSIKSRAGSFLRGARHYVVLLFLLFVLAVYGFLAFRIVTLNQVQPDPGNVASKLKSAGVPHIDQDVLNKIKRLQDNSVDVKSLFDDARSNPFQE